MRWLKRLAWLALALLGGLVLATAALGVAAIQQQPLVVEGSAGSGFDVTRAKALTRHALNTLSAFGDRATLTTSPADIAALLAYTARAVPGAKARADLADDGVRTALTLPLPLPDAPLGRYVNIAVTMRAPQDGLRLQDVHLGGLHFGDGGGVLRVVRFLGDLYAGDSLVTHLVASVRAVEIEDDKVRFTFAPLGPRGRELRSAVQRLGGG